MLLDPLIAWLSFRWRNERYAERVRDFAIDSIIGYLERPERYDPARASLLTYLRLDAHGDLLNHHDRRQRQRERRKEAAVELLEVMLSDAPNPWTPQPLPGGAWPRSSGGRGG